MPLKGAAAVRPHGLLCTPVRACLHLAKRSKEERQQAVARLPVYRYICVLILLYMCTHTTVVLYVSPHYLCVCILLCTCKWHSIECYIYIYAVEDICGSKEVVCVRVRSQVNARMLAAAKLNI